MRESGTDSQRCWAAEASATYSVVTSARACSSVAAAAAGSARMDAADEVIASATVTRPAAHRRAKGRCLMPVSFDDCGVGVMPPRDEGSQNAWVQPQVTAA
ncbi:Uncharacterised protein [Mycobacteroides abscessus]|nr:Uncharacterised protein [Mycobacteroides abscessus]